MESYRLAARFALLLAVGPPTTLVASEPVLRAIFLYGSQFGRPTLDRDAAGGNPFATALIHVLAQKAMSFTAFKDDLIAHTVRASDGVQRPEVIGGDHITQFLPKPSRETWLALVVVFSDYSSKPEIGPTLAGAKRDHQRVAEALRRAGFVVTPLLDPNGEVLEQTLKDFKSRTAQADIALVYTTGHGVEARGISRVLLPYIRANGSDELMISELAEVVNAKRASLIFYAACRTKPRDARAQ